MNNTILASPIIEQADKLVTSLKRISLEARYESRRHLKVVKKAQKRLLRRFVRL